METGLARRKQRRFLRTPICPERLPPSFRAGLPVNVCFMLRQDLVSFKGHQYYKSGGHLLPENSAGLLETESVKYSRNIVCLSFKTGAGTVLRTKKPETAFPEGCSSEVEHISFACSQSQVQSSTPPAKGSRVEGDMIDFSLRTSQPKQIMFDSG